MFKWDAEAPEAKFSKPPLGFGHFNGLTELAAPSSAAASASVRAKKLLDGPTDLERGAGMVGVVPEDSPPVHGTVDLASDGLATIDFLPALRDVNNLSTTAAGGAFLRALRATTLQFDEVTAVEFRLDGSCDAFF